MKKTLLYLTLFIGLFFGCQKSSGYHVAPQTAYEKTNAIYHPPIVETQNKASQLMPKPILAPVEIHPDLRTNTIVIMVNERKDSHALIYSYIYYLIIAMTCVIYYLIVDKRSRNKQKS